MAILLDQITIGELRIAVLDESPTISGYSDVEVGSLAIVKGESGIYQKTGALSTDWTISSVSSEDVQDIVGSLFVDTADIDFTYNDVTNQASNVLTTTGVSAGSYGSASAVGTFTVDNKGRLSAAATTSISITSSQVSDFNEAAQDAVGNILTDSSKIDFTYNDAGNSITATIVAGSLVNADINASAAIDATKIANGTVSNAEFQFLDGVTSNIQTQINGKANTVHTHVSTDITDFTEAAQDAVGTSLVDSATVDFTYNDVANTITASVIQSALDHGSISGLADDDHLQYALLAGRSGGQSLTGGTASANNLTLSSTSNATKGRINLGASSAFDEANTRLGIGSVAPDSVLHLEQNNVRFNVIENSTSTTGAVNAVVASVTTTNNSVELLKVYVTGFNSANNDSVAYERTVRVKNAAGTVSLGTIQADYTSEDASLAAANCTFIVSGSSVDVRVTGVGGTTLTWKVVVQRMR